MPVPTLPRRLWRLVPPIGAGLLLGLLGLEVLARWSWYDGWQDPARHAGPEGEELPVVEALLEMARPNLRALNRNVYFRTNSRGIRGPEYEPRPGPGVFRILVTGDSTTMGSGVPEEDRYTDRLERRLDAEGRGRRYEVVNVGLSGLNTHYVVERLKALAPQYASQLYVYGFSTNDIEGPAYRTRPGGRSPVEAGRNYWAFVGEVERSPSYLWRFLRARWKLRHASVQPDEVIENFLENPAAWSDFLAGLDDFAETSRRDGACGHVLLHPDLWDLDEGHPYLEVYARVERAAVERGLTVSQGFPYVEGRDARALWVSLFDRHPNREGHALLAEALYDGLMRLPPECWEIHR